MVSVNSSFISSKYILLMMLLSTCWGREATIIKQLKSLRCSSK
jgi:hypothetical protein